MPPRPKAKPCPRCERPIQPEAVRCWFCGAVFDTTPCPECHSPVKNGLIACWFCGADMPPAVVLMAPPAPVPPPKEPSQEVGIQTGPKPVPPPPSLLGSHCPHCDAKLPATGRTCLACGEVLTLPRRPVIWEDQPRMRPHRGGTLLSLAVLSLFCCGLILGPIVAITATFDLAAMEEQRMDPLGQGTTRAAQIIAIIGALLSGLVLYLKLGGGRL